MIARERHALTEAALECIVRNTTEPYRLIYTDGQTPDWLWQRLEQRAPEWGLELVRHNEPMWPQALRNRVLDSISTEYAVFIDNDVMVAPGWLEHLIACADETNAGIVAPLYLWGDGVRPSIIHMAGGFLRKVSTPEGDILLQEHAFENQDPITVAEQLVRTRCDYMEFHCTLIRTKPLKEMGGFDERILNIYEHLDIALEMKKYGYEVYMEPASQVNFLHFAPYRLEDIATYRWRWSDAANEASIKALCEKWQVLDHPQAFDGIRNFVAMLAAEVDPLRLSAQGSPALGAPMRREELRQTRSEMLDLASSQGYSSKELTILADAYRLAQSLTDGGYRPCGRPFINHLVGVASVLLRYGFKLEMVLTGLFHTFYSHGPSHPDGVNAAVQMVSNILGGTGSQLEKRVRGYTLRNGDFSEFLIKPTLEMLIPDAEIFMLAAAISIEINFSGEIRYSSRADALSAEFDLALARICDLLEVRGLSMTFNQINRSSTVPAALNTSLNQSYRLLKDKNQAVSMSNNLLKEQQKLTEIQSSTE
jgi:hypothetical protein